MIDWNSKKMLDENKALNFTVTTLSRVLESIYKTLSIAERHLEGHNTIVRRVLHEILELILKVLSSCHSRRARRLQFTVEAAGLCATGEYMTINMTVGDAPLKLLVSPVDSAGIPSLANLSLIDFTLPNATIASVTVDPSKPNRCAVTAIGPGTVDITASATATETDGKTTEQITGVVTINVLAATPPAVAAALVFAIDPDQS